jgi:hypothetical protein
MDGTGKGKAQSVSGQSDRTAPYILPVHAPQFTEQLIYM